MVFVSSGYFYFHSYYTCLVLYLVQLIWQEKILRLLTKNGIKNILFRYQTQVSETSNYSNNNNKVNNPFSLFLPRYQTVQHPGRFQETHTNMLWVNSNNTCLTLLMKAQKAQYFPVQLHPVLLPSLRFFQPHVEKNIYNGILKQTYVTFSSSM